MTPELILVIGSHSDIRLLPLIFTVVYKKRFAKGRSTFGCKKLVEWKKGSGKLPAGNTDAHCESGIFS